jgi:diguanylate cyclase (GGDEF)-like protein
VGIARKRPIRITGAPILTDNKDMRLRFWLGFAVVAAIAIGSVVIALVVHTREEHNFEQMQHSEAVRSARQTEALTDLSVGQLASAAAFFQAEGQFTTHEFGVIADSLLDSGALAATAFVPAVPDSARSSFERNHGFPIIKRSVLGDLHREGHRDFYFPLAYVATKVPLGLTTPFGYDVGTDPTRSRQLFRARDSGRASATPVIRLPSGGTGINVFRPVYRDGATTDTVEQRRAALAGFATGSFRIADLTKAATTALSSDVDVQLLERGRSVVGPSLDRDQSAAARFRVADRTWLLVVRDPNRPGVSLPVLIAVVGISLAAFLAALVLIWSRSERMQELQRQASQDPLTGLKNRRRFEEDLHTELARARREGAESALLMLDLDNFKGVNDTLGHSIGDRVIEEIAEVLRGRARETDVLARLGGDEFALALPRCGIDEALSVAEEVASAVREQVPQRDGIPAVTASIGIAIFDGGPTASAEALVAEADAAMYAAKDAGRDAIRIFDPSAIRSAPDDATRDRSDRRDPV